MTAGILYISYDGMLEPLGQSQVLGYLEGLAPSRRIHLISFEKAADWKDRAHRKALSERIERAGIRWHPLPYHKKPTALATAFDIAAGSAVGIALTLRHRLGVIHARSYVAGLMGLAVKKATGSALLFDMRGFWADERVDGNLWPEGGRLYRAAKAAERRLLLASDEVVTLTHASVNELAGLPYLASRMPLVTVIPTCADLDRFKPGARPPDEPFVLGYAGSVGTWNLLDAMLRCFVLLRAKRPGARLLIANRGEHALIRARAAGHGIGEDELELIAADHADMPATIARMSAGVALAKPAYSKIASAPTKLAEYLGCGVPCLGNRGVGDVEGVLEDNRVGVALTGFSDDELRNGVKRLISLANDSSTRERCRRLAEQQFTRDHGVACYAAIYDRLGNAEP